MRHLNITEERITELYNKIYPMQWITIIGEESSGIIQGHPAISHTVEYKNIKVMINLTYLIDIDVFTYTVRKEAKVSHITWQEQEGYNILLDVSKDTSLIDYAYDIRDYIKSHCYKKLEGVELF